MNDMFIPLPRAVEGMPALLHLAVFLFFAGLLILLFNINSPIAIPIITWIALFLLVYIFITLMPIVRPSSPYHTPFSSLTCFLCARLGYLCFFCLAYIAYRTHLYDAHQKFRELRRHCRSWMLGSQRKVVQKEISDRSSKIDLHILGWTLHALGGDDSLERFFQSIPGFFGSELVQNLRKDFSFGLARTFMETLYGFLNRTLSSTSAPNEDKARRLKIYNDVMKIIPGPTIPSKFIDQAFENGQVEAPKPIEKGETFALWFENTDEKMSKYVQESVVEILSSIHASERDDRWEALAAQLFYLSDHDCTDLHHHINSPNDDVLLYLLNHVISEATFADSLSATSASILTTLSTTLATPEINPDLRRNFCLLWNRNIANAKERVLRANQTPVEILRSIHRVFVALHQAADVEPIDFTTGTVYDGLYRECTLLDHLVVTPLVNPHPPRPTRRDSAPSRDKMRIQVSPHKRHTL